MGLKVKHITHLFLDLDGTLINSLPRLKYIYQDFLNQHDIAATDKEFQHLKTFSIEAFIDYFKRKYVLTPPALKLKKQYECYLEKHYFKAPLFYGAKLFLKEAHQAQLKIYLTSANQKKYAEKILKLHRIDPFFSEILTPKCFGLQTKDTLFYQAALDHLKKPKEQVLVIDDSLDVMALATKMGLNAFLFSKINYHPLPCFGSWKTLTKQWFQYVS